MSLPQSFLDEVRARTSLQALISKTVRLKKAGNEWQACCPFHNEKTPSFYVNDDKAFYHCFGCSAHGDAIRWLTDHEGMEFLDAVRQLAEAAGMEMPAREERRDSRADGMHGLTERAATWFETQLRGLAGGEARAYLDRRGIDDALARRFRLGFAPDSYSRLRSDFKDAGDEALIAAGLLANPEGDREPYDRFRGRVIFPIEDANGRPIAFAGRILGQGEPKYLNSPETALFDKGRTLFNLHRAAPLARKAGRLIAVEGPMDVIGLTRVGIGETVAPQGTALTEAQIAAMWRIAPAPILFFDGDAAGRKAAVRAAIRALPGLEPGRTLSFVVMAAGQDPDDLARGGGKEAVEAVLARAVPLADLLWGHEHDAAPLTTPEARAALRERLVAHARTIQHSDLAREYEQEFRGRVDGLFERARGQRGRGKRKEQPATVEARDPGGIKRKVLTAVLRGLARYPGVLANEVERVVRLPVMTDAHRAALDLLVDRSLGRGTIEAAEVDAMFPGECGYQAFLLSFVKADAYAPAAEADLIATIDFLVAEADGVPVADLIEMARAHKPPKPPEDPPPRKGQAGPLL